VSILFLGAASAFWLGLLTLGSPCPLATNIAAIAFVGRRVASPFKVFLAGLLYTAGRTLTYLLLGVLLVSGLIAAPYLSHLLQKYMNIALGPILILVGMVLVQLIQFRFSGPGLSDNMQKRAQALGIWGALLLGVLFALSFCPVSAALFFGGLLPLAVRNQSAVLLPVAYGLATGLPVLAFSFLIAFGVNRIGRFYDRLVALEQRVRMGTGVVFIIVGIYYCLAYIFGLSIW
jgi:cytochrome c biogenesis protein CcdA